MLFLMSTLIMPISGYYFSELHNAITTEWENYKLTKQNHIYIIWYLNNLLNLK